MGFGTARAFWRGEVGESGSDAGREGFEFGAVFLVAGVVGANFGPEGGGVIKVMEVGEFVEDDIVAQDGRDLHEADVEGDSAGGGTTAPASGGVGESTALIVVAVEGGKVFQAIR